MMELGGNTFNYNEIVSSPEYSFLKENEYLGNNVILLCLGGSHAYGTNTPDSDIDIRGCTLNKKKEILTAANFEQFADTATDTVIYGFNKLIPLLCNCNPNVIEMLGLRPEHYIYVSDVGQELLDNKSLFLSKRAIYSFGGYATSQLRRLENKSVRTASQEQQEIHIMNSINNARYSFPDRYFPENPDDYINLYIDSAVNPEYETEIFMDIHLNHYPLRDYKSMWSEMNSIVKSYSKIGKRNKNAVEHDKLGKHMAHLIRLFMMCLDILEKKEINTFREKEHDLLMDIRNEKYLDENYQPTPEFYEILDEYEKKLDYAKDNTDLPDAPDYKKINDFVMSVNERIVLGKIGG